MKVTVKKIDALKRELLFEIPKERVNKKSDEVFAAFMKQARIPGFRQGKAPRLMVEKAHGKAARDEMIKKLIPEVYLEGIRDEKLDPVEYPAIDQVEVKDSILTFRAMIDVRPEVNIKNYKGIKLAKKSAEITDEELDKTLEFFKKGRGLDENVPVDDALAKSVGFPSLEEFKKGLKRNMEFDKERQNRSDLENQLVEELLKKCDFQVPQSLVQRQFSSRVEDLGRRLKSYGTKDAEIVKKVQEAEKDLTASAEKDVKFFLILQKIAEIESISVNEGENLSTKVIEFLMKEAQWEEAK